MANKSECYSEALSAIKNFTHDELQNYVKNVLVKSKQYENLGPTESLEKAIAEANEHGLKVLYEDVTTKARNVQKFQDLEKKFNAGKITMEEFLVRRGDTKGNAVISSNHATQEQLVKFVYDDFSEEEITWFTNKKNNASVWDEWDGRDSKNPIAKKFALKLRDEYVPERNARLINSTAMSFDEINEDRYFRAVHVARRLINGGKSVMQAALSRGKYDIRKNKQVWIDYIKTKINPLKTFYKTDAVDEHGNIDAKKVDVILSRIFDNIVTNKSKIFTKSVVVNDAEAIAKKSHMFFVWKDMRSLGEYNEKYGQGDMHSMVQHDIVSSANKIGTSRMMGSNPAQMYAALRKIQVQHEINNNVKHTSSDLYWHQNDIYFKNLINAGMNDTGSSASNVIGLIKTGTSIGRLGLKIMGQSLSDVAYTASFAKRVGASSYWQAWGYQMAHLFNLMKDDDRKFYANMMSINCKAHLGYIGRFSEASNFNEVLNKISSGFFKLNLLHAFDNGSRIGGITMIGKSLARASSKSLDAIRETNPDLHKYISKFLDKDEWDLVRKKTEQGRFATDNALNLTDSELRAYRDKTGIDTPLFEIRNDLYRNIHALFDVTAENMVLSPTSFEKAFFGQGLEGTPVGNILSLVTQFKSYTLGYIDRVLVQGYKDADTLSKKAQWASCLVIGTLPLSIASYVFDQIGNNLTVPTSIDGITNQWGNMNASQRENMVMNLVAPSLGILSGFIGPNHSANDILSTFFGSPSTKFIFNLLAGAGSAVSGDWKQGKNGRFTSTKKDLLNAANQFLPLQTIPGISPLISKALDQKPHLLPGQRQLYGA